jgi:hypothetical protein
MNKGVKITIIVIVVLLIIFFGFLRFDFIKFSIKMPPPPEPEEFNATLTIYGDISVKCYTPKECHIILIGGEVNNTGQKVIRSGQIEYTLMEKATNKIVAQETDPFATGLGGINIGKGVSRVFSSRNVFLTKNIPQGEYDLEIKIIDSLTSKTVAQLKIPVSLRELSTEELLERSQKLLERSQKLLEKSPLK